MKKIYNKIKWLPITLLFIVSAASGQTIDSTLQLAQNSVDKAVASQNKLEKLNDESDRLFDQFKLTNKNLEGALVYNAQLTKQIAAQEAYIAQIRESIRDAATLESQMAPLIEGMIFRLRDFVKADIPFHYDLRMEQVQRLIANQSDPKITSAERFRQILETYRIEADYSNNVESYRADIEIDGKVLSVNMLRVGRIMLGYQSDDQKYHGVWDKESRSFVPISAGDYRNAFSELYKITKKQASTNILQLPISAPKTVK